MSKSGLTLEECLSLNELPSYDFISSLADKVCKVLLKEDPSYRPVNCVGEPGSLLDLSGGEEPLPAVIIPDIHARPDFIQNILSCTLPELNLTVLQALKQKKINVICVGDAVHLEMRFIRSFILRAGSLFPWSLKRVNIPAFTCSRK